jgi:hypothetical protein
MRQKMKILAVIMGMFLITLFSAANVIAADKKLVVGAKNFTEQRILGYIMIEFLIGRKMAPGLLYHVSIYQESIQKSGPPARSPDGAYRK